MADDKPGPLARLAGLLGLVQQTEKMIELGTSAVDRDNKATHSQAERRLDRPRDEHAGRAHQSSQ
jgi:hypothetical protein